MSGNGDILDVEGITPVPSPAPVLNDQTAVTLESEIPNGNLKSGNFTSGRSSEPVLPSKITRLEENQTLN
jgi:hypothetical protein